MQTLHALPLLFSFEQIILGDRFVAKVSVKGRALIEMEEGEHWVTSVTPAGVVGSGFDRGSAFLAFRNAWYHVLLDLVAESGTYTAFERAAREFLSSTSSVFDADWKSALDVVRKTKYVDEHLASEPAERAVDQFQVEELQLSGLHPSKNTADTALTTAA